MELWSFRDPCSRGHESGFHWSAMNQRMNEPAVVVEGEDYWRRLGEQRVERHLIHPMRMLIGNIRVIKSTTLTTRTFMLGMFLQKP